MGNKNLADAKRAQYNEFYTQYGDIHSEVGAYLEYNPDVFRGKVVYCNCDDPYESHFFRYFVLNFKRIGIKQLITTSYKPSPIANTQVELFGDHPSLPPSDTRPKITANRFCIINDVEDIDGDKEFTLQQIAERLRANKHNEWAPLVGDGDFRSDESIALLKQADIVVTNPPFSLFREYIKQLMDYEKQFLIISNMNAITYKEVFPLFKDNLIWLGVNNGAKTYQVTDNYRKSNTFIGGNGKKYTTMGNTPWFTNIDHGRRHEPLSLMKESDVVRYITKKPFVKYDNYDAIEVPNVKSIPSDYDGMMGVPSSFLDKYCPDQFEILGTSDNGLVDDKYKTTKGLTQKFVDDYYRAGGTGQYNAGNPTAGYYLDGIATMAYKRIFIRHIPK